MAELKNIGNYFGAAPDRPYHLSIGAIVLNGKNEVYTLHYPNIDHLTNIYVMPNKTVRPNGTLEDAVKRGMLEELGCEIRIITFLGTHVTQDVWWGELGTPTPVEKSVMFFLAQAIAFKPELAAEDSENEHRIVEAHPIEFLLEKMDRLEVKDGMRDFNQSMMLRRAQDWIASHPELISPTLPSQ